MIHQAWDNGAILDGMAEVLGEGIRSICATKTTKTKCGRRVSIALIGNGLATCAECNAAMVKEAEGKLILKGYEFACNEFGFEYANSLSRAEMLSAASLTQGGR